MNFSKVNYGKNSGLKSDTMDFEKHEKPLKYYTTNWDTILKEDAGINFHDGFGTSPNFIDKESKLIRSTITNPKIRQNFGMLPMATSGGLPNSGPVIVDGLLRTSKSCQPLDSKFYKRGFYELDGFKNMTMSISRAGKNSRQEGRSSANDRKN